MARIPCAFSCSREFLTQVDRRAASLGMTRSAYIVQLLRQDIINGSPNLNIVGQNAIVPGKIINNHHMTKLRTKKITNENGH